MAFEDAMALHVLRAAGATYIELADAFGVHTGRVGQVLIGDLHPDSWRAALDRLELGDDRHPRVAELVGMLGRTTLIHAVRAGDPARRRYRRNLRQYSKTTIPFVVKRPNSDAPRLRKAS
jgi:hypothetical protein